MSSNAAQSFPPPTLQPLISKVASTLKSRSETVTFVETACGGLLSSTLLSTPGASQIYKGGLTLYTLPSRTAYAGWTQADIDSYSGPTTDIVAGLAKHVRAELGATYAVAESGTAGPKASGKGENRQPGYVALAVASEDGRVWTKELQTGLGGDRVANMVRFAEEALAFLEDVLEGKAKL